MEGFTIDLKTFWAWLCLTNAPKLPESKYQADFWGDNFSPKSTNLYDPYTYIILLYYIILFFVKLKSCGTQLPCSFHLYLVPRLRSHN